METGAGYRAGLRPKTGGASLGNRDRRSNLQAKLHAPVSLGKPSGDGSGDTGLRSETMALVQSSDGEGSV